MSTKNETIEVNLLVTIGEDGKADIRLKGTDGCPIEPKPVSFPTKSMSWRAYTNTDYAWVCHDSDHTWHLYRRENLGGWQDLGHVGNYQC